MTEHQLDCPCCESEFDNEDDLTYHYGMIHDASIFERQDEIGDFCLICLQPLTIEQKIRGVCAEHG